ncbi:MAG: LCP family protein [Candidatus Buchananbacteria bacterium]
MITKIKIDFLQPEAESPKRSNKSLIAMALALIGLLGLFFYLDLLPYYPNKQANLEKPTFIQQLKMLVSSPERKITGEEVDRVNILLLGVGGKNHAGTELTDTILLTSLKPSTKQLALISIPRDLAANYGNGVWRKINGLNALAEEKNKNSGGSATAQAVSNILQQEIPYYIKIDFTGFEKLIDEFGGVDVYVENTFDDYQYPVAGQEEALTDAQRYSHLHFDKGWQHLNGERALQYARSRHAAGIEGSDFARARRQQKILEALKTKIFSLGTFINPYRLEALVSTYQQNVSTNLKLWEILRLVSLVKKNTDQKIITEVFDNSLSSPLTEQTVNGSYLLIPKLGWGNFLELQDITANIFNQAENITVSEEKAKIIVENGTLTNGLASQIAKQLRAQGLTVLFTRNALSQDYNQTIIYDLTAGQKSATAKILQQHFNTSPQTTLPGWLQDQTKDASLPQIDFLIILGANTASLTN